MVEAHPHEPVGIEKEGEKREGGRRGIKDEEGVKEGEREKT